ncbi:hypothetical protein [Amycolatopsis jejuensis]|uniref:hypothetical protein n=1 Tax=Amycolatopsis jejuensis TaxID=330084 RepID=UPI0012E08CDE|nr:hypothetical protein [Amycolatopsis jejuensis]
MDDDSVDDAVIFAIPAPALLDGIRAAASSGKVDPGPEFLLNRCGLVYGGELTEAGRALFKLAWVLRKTDEAQQALGRALRQLTPIQVIEQELHGLGAVPEAGVLDLLRQHRAVGAEVSVDDIRPTLRWLNAVGVLVYSTKLKTVRSLAPAPDAALAGEVQAIAAMVSPKTPYLNVVRLRRVLRALKGIVWWADPHFGARALEEIAEELDTGFVTEIRIISGDAENVVSPKSMKDFARFRAEMANKGVVAEWRVDGKFNRDWHDRWIADDKVTWNVPPINTLLKNDYSEISPATERPPLPTWWKRSSPRT